jgi:hypothetical protein
VRSAAKRINEPRFDTYSKPYSVSKVGSNGYRAPQISSKCSAFAGHTQRFPNPLCSIGGPELDHLWARSR